MTAKPMSRAAYGEAMFARYLALDRALVAKGFHETSPWWLLQVQRYFEAGQRQMVLRVGRRGGKSSTLSRLGVVEALYGAHVVPPGDLGIVAFVSVSRDEASQRLRTIKAILDALKVKYGPIDGGIELAGRPVAFKVFTASVSGVSGFTCICAICDEVSKWRDADTGANPAREVLSSLRPTLATQRLAKIILSSSPLGRLDAHAVAFDAGDTGHQLVAFAETWTANPSITEDDCHALEPDEDRFAREYGARPLEETESSLLSAATLDRVTRSQPGDILPEAGVQYVCAIDPSEGKNGFTMAIAGRRHVGDRIRRSIVLTREWRSSKGAPLDPAWVLGQIVSLCAPYHIEEAYTDQFSGAALAAIAARLDFYLRVEPASQGSKIQLFEDLNTRMSDGEDEIPPDPQLRADLLAVRRVLTANGFVIRLDRTSDGRHADHASSCAVALDKCRVDPPPLAPKPNSKAYYAALDAMAEESALRGFRQRGQAASTEWWEQDAKAAGYL